MPDRDLRFQQTPVENRGHSRTGMGRRAAADRTFAYWAVSSCLLLLLAFILTIVVAGKLRSFTTAMNRQTAEVEALSNRVRALEARHPDSAPVTQPGPHVP